MKISDRIRGLAMDDISRLSIAELEDKKIALDEWIDELATELAEINRELIVRFQAFRALCLAPVEELKATQPPGRGAPKAN
jgi:hypothetical protein